MLDPPYPFENKVPDANAWSHSFDHCWRLFTDMKRALSARASIVSLGKKPFDQLRE